MEAIQQFLLSKQVLDANEVVVTSSATVTTKVLKVYEQTVRVITDASHAIQVTLPPVREARGKAYSIALVTDGNANLTVVSAGDSAVAISDTYADANDRAVYFSDGLYWHVLASSGI